MNLKWMLFVGVVFFIGCDEYISKVPVTERPNSEISSELLGRWVSIGICNESYTICNYPMIKFELLEWGNMEYLLMLGDDRAVDSKIPYKLWNSKINKVNYLNLYPLQQEKRDSKYFILKYRIKNDLLEVKPLRLRNKLVERFDIKLDFKNYIEENQVEFDGFFDEGGPVFYRWENLNWKFINELHISNIISIRNDGKSVDKDSMLNEFDKYHLLESKPSKQDYEPSTPYLIESMGDTFKILKTNNTLYDIRDDNWYAKTQKK